MIYKMTQFCAFTVLVFFGTPAAAQGYFFHMQGPVGDREAYFADTIVLDRTPQAMMLGPKEVRQLDVTVVYENAQKPEYAEMRLQFQCAVKYDNGSGIPRPPSPNEPVTMRLGEGSSYLRRIDSQNVDTPPTAWRTISTPVLLKAHKIACNGDDLRKAMRDSYDGRHFSQARFNEKARALGVSDTVTIVPDYLGSLVLEFVWKRLWPEAEHPDPSGRWATPVTAERRAEALAQVAQMRQQVEALNTRTVAAYQPRIQSAETRADFDRKATELRAGQRSMSRSETRLIALWQGKTEPEVIAVMGRPSVVERADLRFLDYERSFDNSVTTVEASGETWHEGVWNSCDLSFILMPDNENVMRVADLRIETDGSNVGIRSQACGNLLKPPN